MVQIAYLQLVEHLLDLGNGQSVALDPVRTPRSIPFTAATDFLTAVVNRPMVSDRENSSERLTAMFLARYFFSIAILYGIWKTLPPVLRDILIVFGSFLLFAFVMSIIDYDLFDQDESPPETNPNHSPTP